MAVISGGMVIEGGIGHAIPIPGAPAAGTNEVQTLTIGATPTGGTFILGFEGRSTAAISWAAVNATLLASMVTALDAAFGTASVVPTAGTLTAGVGTILLTFGAAYARRAVPTIVVVNNSLTPAATLTNAETTPGVDATYRGATTGSELVRVDTGVKYVNTSTTAGAPTWVVVGSQT